MSQIYGFVCSLQPGTIGKLDDIVTVHSSATAVVPIQTEPALRRHCF